MYCCDFLCFPWDTSSCQYSLNTQSITVIDWLEGFERSAHASTCSSDAMIDSYGGCQFSEPVIEH